MLEKFYGDILPQDGHFCLFFVDKKKHSWVQSHEALVQLTEHQGDRQGVYFATAAYDGVPDAEGKLHRAQGNVLALRSLRLDIDAGASKFERQPTQVYETQKAALAAFVAFTAATKLAPTYIVSSGDGLHIYYCLDQDLSPADWLPLAKGLGQLCKDHGLRVDPTTTEDTARILRPIGTVHKSGRRVAVVKDTGVKHSVLGLRALLPEVEVDPLAALAGARKFDMSINEDVATYQGPPSSALKVAEKCAALREVAETRGDVLEPHWRAMIGIVKHSAEGLDLAHEWSSGYDGYDERETIRKFDAWAKGPTTCAEFSKHSSACATCEFNGKVTSPIQLGRMTTPEIEQLPPESPAAAILTPAAPKPAPGKPWDGALPAGFDVETDRNGTQQLVYSMLTERENDDGDMVPALIKIPFTRDIFWLGQWAEADNNIDTAQVTLHLWTGSGVKNYLLDQTLVASLSELLKYLAGKAIHTTTHKKAPQAMQDYMKASLQRMKHTAKRPKVGDHLGLRILDNGELVAAQGEHVIFPDGSIHRGMLSNHLIHVAADFKVPVPENTIGVWGPEVWEAEIVPKARKHVDFLKKYYGTEGMERFQLAIMLGLCSPLMAFVTGEFHAGTSLPKMSALSVSLYSRDTARGKTTACMSAVLAYGKPSDLANDSGKAGTTDNARISRLSMHGTLPNVMDEMGGATPASVASVISAVANGAGKQRATRDGGLASGTPWALINLITTNTSQRDMVSAVQANSSAIQYRLLEINMDGVPEFSMDAVASFTDDWADLNRTCTGALGAVIHREICALGAERVGKLVTECVARAAQMMGATQSARFQFRALGAMLALQTMLARLNLVAFPLKPLVETFKVAYDSGVEFVVDNILPSNSLELLMRALRDLAPNTIVTESVTRVNRHMKHDVALNARMPDVIKARHAKSLRMTWVPVTVLRDWCVEHGVSDRQIIRDAKAAGIIDVHKRVQSSGQSLVAAEYFNLTAGLADNMNLRTRCYSVRVGALARQLGIVMDEDEGTSEGNVVQLRPGDAPADEPAAEVAAT